MNAEELKGLLELCRGPRFCTDPNCTAGRIADQVPELIDEIKRLRIEASVWKRLAADNHGGDCMNGIDNGDPCICGLNAAESGDFAAASKLLDEAGYEENV